MKNKMSLREFAEAIGVSPSTVSKALNDGGAFSTFCYIQGMFLTASHRFRRKIFDRFPDTVKMDIAWRNLPPAYCYYCEKT